MISYRQADLIQMQKHIEEMPLIVDMLHTSSGMTVLDHVYGETDRDASVISEKEEYLKSLIRSIMKEMGIWFDRHQNHDRQQGFNNIVNIMKRVKQDPRVTSVTEKFTDEDLREKYIQHFLYLVRVK